MALVDPQLRSYLSPSDRVSKDTAVSLPVLLILYTALGSSEGEVTSEVKQDSTQWNPRCMNAIQHGEKRGEGGEI